MGLFFFVIQLAQFPENGQRTAANGLFHYFFFFGPLAFEFFHQPGFENLLEHIKELFQLVWPGRSQVSRAGPGGDAYSLLECRE